MSDSAYELSRIHAKQVADARESGIRDALIAMGWLPPAEVQRLQTQLDAVRELSPDALILLGWMTKAAGAWTTGEMRELTGLNHPHRAAHELVAAGLIKRLPETYFKTPRMAALEQEQEQGAKLKEMVMSDWNIPRKYLDQRKENERLRAEVKRQAMRIKVLTRTVNMQADALDAVRALPEKLRASVIRFATDDYEAGYLAGMNDAADELEAKLKEAMG